jgi:hypothetical protein
MGGFIEHVVEMASGRMIYIPNFMKINTGVQVVTHKERKKKESITKNATHPRDKGKINIQEDRHNMAEKSEHT